jgi:hypothetical protein
VEINCNRGDKSVKEKIKLYSGRYSVRDEEVNCKRGDRL